MQPATEEIEIDTDPKQVLEDLRRELADVNTQIMRYQMDLQRPGDNQFSPERDRLYEEAKARRDRIEDQIRSLEAENENKKTPDQTLDEAYDQIHAHLAPDVAMVQTADNGVAIDQTQPAMRDVGRLYL